MAGSDTASAVVDFTEVDSMAVAADFTEAVVTAADIGNSQ
jgi:hypothetical protein